jgi:hypothetical protein
LAPSIEGLAVDLERVDDLDGGTSVVVARQLPPQW